MATVLGSPVTPSCRGREHGGHAGGLLGPPRGSSAGNGNSPEGPGRARLQGQLGSAFRPCSEHSFGPCPSASWPCRPPLGV